MLKIDKGTPLPRRGIRKDDPKHIPFRDMEVGDSVLVPHSLVPRKSILARVADINRRYPRGHWVTRKEGDATRIYRTYEYNGVEDLI